jgi:hypothetical protein
MDQEPTELLRARLKVIDLQLQLQEAEAELKIELTAYRAELADAVYRLETEVGGAG